MLVFGFIVQGLTVEGFALRDLGVYRFSYMRDRHKALACEETRFERELTL